MDNCKHPSMDLGFFISGDWGCLRCGTKIEAHEIIMPVTKRYPGLLLFVAGVLGWALFGAALYLMFRPMF
jgi:hypothetical protein